MPSTNAAVIYGTISGLVRWYVHADTDAEIAQVSPGAGESLLITPLETRLNMAQTTYQAAVNAHTGLVPGAATCAVLDSSGNVLLTVLADPNLDSASIIHPQGASLMACPGLSVAPGDRWNAGWQRFYSIALKSTNIVTAQAWLALVNPVPPNAVTEFVAPSSFAIGAIMPVKGQAVSSSAT